MSDESSEAVEDQLEGKQADLFDHLAELRSRIMRGAIYVAVGALVGWVFYDFFFRLLSAPVKPCLKGTSFLLTSVTEGFVIKMEVSLLVGLIITLPLITLEAWRFIAPGLTRTERKAVWLVAPLSILLFAAGVLLAYAILPVGIRWLVGQNPPGALFMPSVAQTLLFILKMCLAFGLVFQLPVVLMFLARVGLVSSGMLKTYWRQSVVAIGIIAAIVTPSSDAFSMLMMAAPMFGLYVLSIGLVRIVEKQARQ
jgi:sec-independent protein translocase protein TatC